MIKINKFMKIIPSFEDFEQYEGLIENLDPSLLKELRSIEIPEITSPINEGRIANFLTNKLSKFLLGSFSGVGMIDEAIKVVLAIELDLIQKASDFKKEVAKIEDQIDQLAKEKNTDKITALSKEREAKMNEFDAYEKAQNLKLKKARDVAKQIVNGNSRRKEYLDSCYAENEIEMAELEYRLAKERSEDQTALKSYEEKLAKAREEAEAKAKEIEEQMKKEEDNKEPKEVKTEVSFDVEKEKKIISRRKGGDVIKRKNELEKEIADIKSDMERRLNQISNKIKKSTKPLTERYLENAKLDLIEMATALDYKKELLSTFRNLGKNATEIEKSLGNNKEFKDAIDKINKGAGNAKQIKGEVLKAFRDAFSTVGIGKSGVLTTGIIDNLKEKINK
jgi:DNA repair exonuclease SbcCD ATPase subunit